MANMLRSALSGSLGSKHYEVEPESAEPQTCEPGLGLVAQELREELILLNGCE